MWIMCSHWLRAVTQSGDREEARTTWYQNWPPNQIKLVVKAKKIIWTIRSQPDGHRRLIVCVTARRQGLNGAGDWIHIANSWPYYYWSTTSVSQYFHILSSIYLPLKGNNSHNLIVKLIKTIHATFNTQMLNLWSKNICGYKSCVFFGD
jgi:hypothetical protein